MQPIEDAGICQSYIWTERIGILEKQKTKQNEFRLLWAENRIPAGNVPGRKPATFSLEFAI